MHKALYFISEQFFDDVYGPQARSSIEARVEVDGLLITPAFYKSSERVWPEISMIFSGWGMVRIDETFLRRFPKLQVIFYAAGSVKGIVTEACWRQGIQLTSAYAANAIPVREFTISQILFALKRGWQQVLSGRRNKQFIKDPRIPGAYQTTVGLLSLGMVGRGVGQHLKEFDLKVIAYDPIISKSEAEKLNVKLVPLEEVFATADVVSCHTPLLKKTEKMIRGRHFESMKPGATFINTARGGVIDEGEMIEVLRNRPDLVAVLDVTYPEPPVENSPLYSLENVILTPHIAGSEGRECRRMGRVMVEELDRFLSGKPLRYRVDEKAAAYLA